MIGLIAAFIAGVLTTYAAIAGYFGAERRYYDRRPVPGFPPPPVDDPEAHVAAPGVTVTEYRPQRTSEGVWLDEGHPLHRADSVAGGVDDFGDIVPPGVDRIPSSVHDALCRYPTRPCVCFVGRSTTQP